VFLKAPQVRLEQVKRPLRIPRIDARSPQTDYEAFLLLYDAPPLGDELPGARRSFSDPFIQITRKGRKQATSEKIERPKTTSTRALRPISPSCRSVSGRGIE
jgi:hypothetical protein